MLRLWGLALEPKDSQTCDSAKFPKQISADGGHATPNVLGALDERLGSVVVWLSAANFVSRILQRSIIRTEEYSLCDWHIRGREQQARRAMRVRWNVMPLDNFFR